MRPRLAAALPLAITFAIAGCGIKDPYQNTPHTTTTNTPATTPTTAPADLPDPPPERGGTIPRPAQATQNKLAPRAGAPTPQAALERYATLYINWNAGNVIQIQRQLASISLDQARDLARQAVASAAHDHLLSQSQVANSGQVISLAQGQGAAAREWVLVTREHTTGTGDYSGLPAMLHVTYAQLTRTSQGWIVSGWDPQT
jgi:hypothetical protein